MTEQRIPVGVVIERRRAVSQWIDHVWRPVAVLPGVPATAPWTPLGSEDGVDRFFAGAAEIALHRTETGNYRDNLASGRPALWVVLRATGAEPPFEIATVTADPAEGEAMTENGGDLVEVVPMPEDIRLAVDGFVAAHHVEQPFLKRKRDRADPDALGRRSRVEDED